MQTHSIEGLNYTLPADWEQLDVDADSLAELDQIEGIDLSDADQVSDLVAWTKNDGFFVAVAVADPDTAEVTVDDLDVAAAYVNAAASGTVFDGVSAVAATDQGCPAIVLTTSNIALNGVSYALTVELFAVDSASFQGAVVMASLLPASGTVSDDLDTRFDPVAVDTDVTVGDVTFTVPAGSELVEGNVFAVDFVFASLLEGDGQGFVFAVSSPLDFESVLGAVLTVSDLQELADELTDELDDALDELVDPSLGFSFEDVWVGAYNWLNIPTLGLDCTITDGSSNVYAAVTASCTASDITVFLLAEPDGSTFAEDLLMGASANGVTGAVDIEASAAATDTSDQPGFVVGFSAADGARDAA
jgi:hypothetical protein